MLSQKRVFPQRVRFLGPLVRGLAALLVRLLWRSNIYKLGVKYGKIGHHQSTPFRGCRNISFYQQHTARIQSLRKKSTYNIDIGNDSEEKILEQSLQKRIHV